jgi:hypothetical protein
VGMKDRNELAEESTVQEIASESDRQMDIHIWTQNSRVLEMFTGRGQNRDWVVQLSAQLLACLLGN